MSEELIDFKRMPFPRESKKDFGHFLTGLGVDSTGGAALSRVKATLNFFQNPIESFQVSSIGS